MAFTGVEDHSITLDEAAHLTKNYREHAGEGAILAEYFSQAGIDKVLRQKGSVGLRVYYGRRDDSTPVLVLVGVKAGGEDMTEGELAQFGAQCPPFCSPANPLNS